MFKPSRRGGARADIRATDTMMERTVGVAPSTVTIKLAQRRDMRGRFMRRETIALADWIDDVIYPAITIWNPRKNASKIQARWRARYQRALTA